jgi:hypothetical protein
LRHGKENISPLSGSLTKSTTDSFIKAQIGPKHVKVKVKFSLERAIKAQRWSRGIALLFL